jgi:hypothetical protein
MRKGREAYSYTSKILVTEICRWEIFAKYLSLFS